MSYHRFHCLFFALVVSISSLAQTKNSINIQWVAPQSSDPNALLQCIGCLENDETGTLIYSNLQRVPENMLVDKAEISVLETTELTEPEKIKILKYSDEVMQTPKLMFSNSSQRMTPYLVYSFVPMIKQNGQVRKIETFSLKVSYRPKDAPTRKSRSFAASSVLSSGDWYKIGVVADGLYKIPYSFLEDLGVDLATINPQSINIYGNGAGLLAENNSEFRYDDLTKNAIAFVGDETDGTFDEDDFILFYAKGPHRIEQSGQDLIHRFNHFSDTSYYFIRIDDSDPPKRLSVQSQSTNLPSETVTSFNDYLYSEKERVNFWESGKEWYGDTYSAINEAYSYSFSLPNITSDSVKIVTRLASRSVGGTNFTVSASGTSETVGFTAIPSSSYQYATAGTSTLFLSNAPSTINVSVGYDYGGSLTAEGYLDVIEVNARRSLAMVGTSMEFKDINSVGIGNVSEFQLSGATQVIEIWDVTDHHSASKIDFTDLSSVKTFVVDTDTLRTFVALTANAGSTPVPFGKVENQNLHALDYADVILVTPASLLAQANELANFHRSKGNSVHVVTPNNIFNEFSSGMRDATAIRHFLRMFYVRAGSDPNLIPKHLLLFGDGSYDNKGMLNSFENLIPTYQSNAHLVKTSTFTSDDFFVVLDNNAGFAASDLLDMSVGRLPVSNTVEAAAMVEKIKKYAERSSSVGNGGVSCGNQNASTFGNWKNKLMMVSDDEDGGTYFLHTEEVAGRIENDYPWMNINKVHSDAFVQESTPGGERYYDVYDEIKSEVESGVLGVNYIGHGGEVGWATERFLDLSMVRGWTNFSRLPFFMTATCEFSRFDDPDRTSAGEELLLNAEGGAIAMFTTTRLVYAGPNLTINKKFYDTVFRRDVNGKGQSFGSIYVGTKNSYANASGTENGRKFSLLGDPVLQLALPEYNIVTDAINDSAIGVSELDTLTALGKIKIEGHIEDWSGATMNSFNGVVYLTVYDKPQEFSTLANNASSGLFNFEEQNSIIYKGKSTVNNGLFSFTFVAPKDLNLQYGKGKLSYYAENGEVDATGYSDSLTIGGINLLAEEDNVGPQIDLYMNDTNFVFGGLTSQSPTLLAFLSDSNGINTTGNSIGHDLVATLDGNTANGIVLNDYYESDLDTYQKGSVAYKLEDLEEGVHTLELKAWDVHNNSSSDRTEFVVALSEEMALDHVLNYPNPFTTYTEFMLEHNQVCAHVDVQIQIFTVSGRLVKTLNRSLHADGFRVSGIGWNGTDEYGDRLAKGTYFYRVKVNTDNGAAAEKYERLVILK